MKTTTHHSFRKHNVVLSALLMLLFSNRETLGQDWIVPYPDSISGDVSYHKEKYDIEIDADNNKWVGYKQLGLRKFNGLSWEIWDTGNSSIPSNLINDISISGTDIWMATDKGIVWFNQTDFASFDTSNVTSVSNFGSVLCAAGKVYASSDSVVMIFDNNIWTAVPYPDTLIISYPRKFPMQVDSNGYLWIGLNNGIY